LDRILDELSAAALVLASVGLRLKIQLKALAKYALLWGLLNISNFAPSDLVGNLTASDLFQRTSTSVLLWRVRAKGATVETWMEVTTVTALKVMSSTALAENVSTSMNARVAITHVDLASV